MKKETKLFLRSRFETEFFCLLYCCSAYILSDFLFSDLFYVILLIKMFSILTFLGSTGYVIITLYMNFAEKEIDLIEQKKSLFFDKDINHATDFMFTTKNIKGLEVSK